MLIVVTLHPAARHVAEAPRSPGPVVPTLVRLEVAGRSLSHNARALALVNMAINDSLIASFANKYLYTRSATGVRSNPATD